MFAVNGILFNHESPRRGETFVTRKITRAVARIKLGCKTMCTGNLNAVRDWGMRPSTCRDVEDVAGGRAFGLRPATGEGYSVEQFVSAAFSAAGMNWRDYVKFDSRYLRPTEVDALRGDPTRAYTELGWQPQVYGDRLVELMVEADIAALDIRGPVAPDVPMFTALNCGE